MNRRDPTMADSHSDIWVQLATAASEWPGTFHGTADEMKEQMLGAASQQRYRLSADPARHHLAQRALAADDYAVVRDGRRPRHLPDHNLGVDDMPPDRRCVYQRDGYWMTRADVVTVLVHGVSAGFGHPRTAARRRRDARLVRGLEDGDRVSRRRVHPRAGTGALTQALIRRYSGCSGATQGKAAGAQEND